MFFEYFFHLHKLFYRLEKSSFSSLMNSNTQPTDCPRYKGSPLFYYGGLFCLLIGR
jgi:hypothetical protein